MSRTHCVLDDPRLPPRFWDKVQPEPTSGCWLWAGSTDRRGYGQLRFHRGPGGLRYTHRLVLLDAAVPGLVVDHLCRTPCCCNPAHLEQVTQAENIARGRMRSAQKAAAHLAAETRRDCRNGHKDVVWIANGKAGRTCTECYTARQKRRYA